MATLSPFPKLQFFDETGAPLVGGKLYTYLAGTTTPQNTFVDYTGAIANTNPIILDVNGQANVWLASGVSYKFVLNNAADVLLWTVDNITSAGSMSVQNSNAVDITGGTIGGVTLTGVTINGGINGTATNVTGVVAIANGGTNATTSSQARTNLGLGTLATQAANAVAITGGTAQLTALGVGTAASGTTGEIRATNNITAYYSSDRNLKENITPIIGALDKVEALSGVYFDWTDDYIAKHGGEDGVFVRKHDVGLIAQDVEAVLPEIVVTREDGTKAIKYDRVVALLIEAIKELKNAR